MNARSASLPRLRGLILGAVLLAALVIALPVAPAGAAEPDDASWAVRTASGTLGPDRTSFSYTIDPGGSLTDALVVVNHGQAPLDLKVYAADGFTSAAGELSLLLSGEQSHAIGAWITPAENAVTVAPGETTTVPFTVGIPANATPGDYAGGVVTSLTVPDAATGVSVDRRLGIRVNLRVGGELSPSLAIEDLSVSWDGGLNPFAGGDAAVTYTLHNTGNAAISADPSVRAGGVLGLFAAEADDDGAVPELLPGESWTQTATVAGVPPVFALLASITLTPLVTDAVGSTSPIAEVSATAVGLAVPWTLLLLLALVVAALVLLLRRRGRRRAAEKARLDARVDQAVEKALEQERAKVSADASS